MIHYRDAINYLQFKNDSAAQLQSRVLPPPNTSSGLGTFRKEFPIESFIGTNGTASSSCVVDSHIYNDPSFFRINQYNNFGDGRIVTRHREAFAQVGGYSTVRVNFQLSGPATIVLLYNLLARAEGGSQGERNECLAKIEIVNRDTGFIHAGIEADGFLGQMRQGDQIITLPRGRYKFEAKRRSWRFTELNPNPLFLQSTVRADFTLEVPGVRVTYRIPGVRPMPNPQPVPPPDQQPIP